MVNPALLADLPWFTLCHYDPCAAWGLREWFQAISNRLAIHESNLGGYWRCQADIDEHFAKISANVIRPGGITWSTPGRTSSLFLGTPGLEPSALEKFALQSPLVETSTEMATGYWEIHWGRNFRLLAVDLSAPDSAIRESLSLWLKKARESEDTSACVTDADLRAWATCYALAFIDINLYAAATGARYTYAQIADTLFPDAEVDRVERLRKVTIKHAKRLLSHDMRLRLAGQVGASAPHMPEASFDGTEAEPY